jgi:hypothetical protein
MTTARARLLSHVDDPEFHQLTRAELEPLWIEAANEELARQRPRIPVLARLCDDLGITAIASLDDLVPLLFAHSNYKSYPESFIANGRWELMNTWLDSLSSERVDGIDLDGVRDQDDWIERLHAKDHLVFVSSGTTGKSSFLPATPSDRDFSLKFLEVTLDRNRGRGRRNDRAVFVLGPKYGPNRAALHFRTMAEMFGRPDATYFLTEEPMRVADLSRMADLRRRITDGTAKPSEIAAFEKESADNQRLMDERLDRLIDGVIEHHDEPMIIAGFWAQYWQIVQRAQAKGLKAGDFHPDIQLSGGGGVKGVVLPPDYKEQILGFFGIDPATMTNGYGMSELSAALPGIDGRYRPVPWVIPLLLDDTGERLLSAGSGLVEGRMAFFDLAIEGRWGGVVTGDHVTADFSTPNTSVVADSITRYSLMEGGDDKLTCAGTIDAYVRGVTG